MDELFKTWLSPEYIIMLGIVTLTVKLIVVPIIKSIVGGDNLNVKGHSSIIFAYIASIALSFAYKSLFAVGIWDARNIVMTVLVGIFSACSAIGLNISTQTLKGRDVSIVG